LGRLLAADEMRQRCETELPGRLEQVCIDTHQRLDSESGAVQVMLVAVRRDVLEGYQRIFSGARLHVCRFITNEVSRYNAALYADHTLGRRKILLLSLGKEGAELSVWDRGVRVDGCSVGSQRGFSVLNVQSPSGCSRGSSTPAAESLIQEVIGAAQRLVNSQQSRVRPIEKIVCCGPEQGNSLKRNAIRAALAPQISMRELLDPLGCESLTTDGCSVPNRDQLAGDFQEAFGAGLSELEGRGGWGIEWSSEGMLIQDRNRAHRWGMGTASEGRV
jgi:hypothetical protein